MKIPRGKLLALVAIFAAIGIVTATGAFTSVSAERTATIDVAGDDAALLGLTSNHAIVEQTDGTMQLNFDNIEGASASGVNYNAQTSYAAVFTIANNGADDVAVDIATNDTGDNDPGHADAVSFVVNQSQLDASAIGSISALSHNNMFNGDTVYSITTHNGNQVEIPSGESVTVGLFIDTTGADFDNASDYDEDPPDLVDDITIRADADDVADSGDKLRVPSSN